MLTLAKTVALAWQGGTKNLADSSTPGKACRDEPNLSYALGSVT